MHVLVCIVHCWYVLPLMSACFRTFESASIFAPFRAPVRHRFLMRFSWSLQDDNTAMNLNAGPVQLWFDDTVQQDEYK